MVPEAGIEPTTFGLEGHCSSTELLGHMCITYLSIPPSSNKKILISKSWQLPTLSHLVDAIPSALAGLTSVFGMDTGVPQPS